MIKRRQRKEKSKNHSVMYHLVGIYFSYLNTRRSDRKFNNIHRELDCLDAYGDMMLFSYIFLPTIFCFFTGLLGWTIAASGRPIDSLVLVFIVISVLQSGLWYFTVFFENKDKDLFMAMPIAEEDIFKSKWISSGLSTFLSFVGVLPFICFFIAYRGFGFWGIPLGILVFAVILVIIVNLCVIAIHLAPINSFMMKHIANIRAILTFSFAATALFFGTVLQHNDDSQKVVKFGPLSQALSSLKGIIAFVVIGAAIALALGFYIKHKYSITYYQRTEKIRYAQKMKSIEGFGGRNKRGEGYVNSSITDDNLASSTNSFSHPKGANKSNDVVNILAKNTISSMKEESSILQQTIGSVVLPVIIIPSLYQFGIKEVLGKNFLIDLTFCLIFSVFMVLFTYGVSTTLPSILVSIDGHTFESIKALPLNLRLYLMSRIKILVKAFMPLPFLVNIGAMVFFGVSVKAIAIAALIYIILSFMVSISKILSDFLNPFLDWTNLNQLYMREGRLKPVVVSMSIFAVFFASMGVFTFLVEKNLIVWMLGFGIALTVVLASVSFLKIYWKLSKISMK